MIYKWLVIWWVITISQQSQVNGDGAVISKECIENSYTSVFKHISLEETHQTMNVNFCLFKTKDEAEAYIKSGSYGYSGNTKHKYQLVELNPTIEWQRPDALERDKELLKNE